MLSDRVQGNVVMVSSTEAVRDALLLDPAMRATCPEYEQEFNLEEDVAVKSPAAVADASHDVLARRGARTRAVRP